MAQYISFNTLKMERVERGEGLQSFICLSVCTSYWFIFCETASYTYLCSIINASILPR